MKDQLMHISEQEMIAYIRNEGSEQLRERVELEIQLCEQCMERFVLLLDQLPTDSTLDPEVVSNQVMDTIRQQAVVTKPRWIQRPVVQYGIAASITLLLVTSGLMSTVSHTLVKLDRTVQSQNIEQLPAPESSAETRSEKWLDKASRWIEAVQDSRFEK
ncbi:MAG: hypothetical protein NAG76_04780 [Candidatus Pristimantibacillus lignocellulolyticus]|uniref:Zinc-finger domain-containing protein n=1 Tax=Candidatus Pristimantibacillus lignocellulolyticus TaxID=2994561 RepID=A0A9J6ZH96_9BACL|nr:MAG: hypothetical protein NAG76_04780 [Candidatus Pristimantibacillus lignocellulolyticus]